MTYFFDQFMIFKRVYLLIIISSLLILAVAFYAYSSISRRGSIKYSSDLDINLDRKVVDVYSLNTSIAYTVNTTFHIYVNNIPVKPHEIPSTHYIEFDAKPGDTIMMEITYYNFENKTIYVFTDLTVEEDTADYYLNKCVDLYEAYRAVWTVYVPSNMIVNKLPGLIEIPPHMSSEVQLIFSVSRDSPSGLYPIAIGTYQFYLENNTLFFEDNVFTIYAINISK